MVLLAAAGGGIAIFDRAGAAESKVFSADDIFKGPESVDLKPGAVDLIKNVIQQAQPPLTDCPTEATVTVTAFHAEKTFSTALGTARRDALDAALRGLNLPRVEYSFQHKDTLANTVIVNADTKADRERPKLDTTSVPRKGTKVKAGDKIEVRMVARDQANLWQTGIKTIQLVADSENGRLIASENFIPVTRVCAGLQPERRVVATYTVPNNPPPIVRLTALAEDLVGLIDTDVGEFPTEGDWFGTITWFHHGKEDTTAPPDRSRAEVKFDGSADIILNYDGRGNLTGSLRGSWKVDTHWWGYPIGGAPYSGQVCKGFVPSTPVSADLLGSYTPGVEALTLQPVNTVAKVVVPWTGGGPNVKCTDIPFDYSSTLAALIRSRLERAPDGTYHFESNSSSAQHDFRYSLKLQRVQN